MEINKERIEQAVIEQVVNSMVTDGDLERRIKAVVEARIDAYFKSIGDSQISVAVNKAITSGFEHEYCRVDSMGRRQGEPTTISKELDRVVSGYWNCRVDSSGTPTDSTYSSISRAEWQMLQIVAGDFSKEMKQHIVNLGASLKDSLRTELRSTLDKLLSEVFYVQSNGDRELGKPGHSCIDPEQTGKR